MKKLLYSLVVILIGINAVIWSFVLDDPSGLLEVHFLDVGQGDAILIETPSGRQVLIDGGPDTSVLRELGSVLPFGDRSLDMLVLSHGDKDHVGGFPAVLERYNVDHVLATVYESDSGTFKTFKERSEIERAYDITAERGQVIDLGDGIVLTIIYPDENALRFASDINNTSIVVRLDYGELSFLFTGDIEKKVEGYLVSQYGGTGLLDVDVLKVAHHGSKTSSIADFLHAATPEYVVIQVGKENRYGHPDEGVLHRLGEFTSEIYRTDEMGRVMFVSDGGWLEVRSKKGMR